MQITQQQAGITDLMHQILSSRSGMSLSQLLSRFFALRRQLSRRLLQDRSSAIRIEAIPGCRHQSRDRPSNACHNSRVPTTLGSPLPRKILTDARQSSTPIYPPGHDHPAPSRTTRTTDQLQQNQRNVGITPRHPPAMIGIVLSPLA